MTKSVSNDALWEKLSEMDKKFEEFSVTLKLMATSREQVESTPDFNEIKDEIVTSIKSDIRILGLSNDSHFEANRTNIQLLNENILTILKVVNRIRKQQRKPVEPENVDDYYFDFRLFKIRKTSFVITILGLLVFILTLFCMKQ
jgi:hypothetical protein